MASIEFNAHVDTPKTGILARIGQFILNSVEASARERSRRIAALQALSDKELRARGIRRENIVQYVFRDICYI